MAAPAAIPYLIMAGVKIYKVANNPATRKWARSLMKKGVAKKIKKPTPAQIKKANPLTTTTMKKQIESGGRKKGIEGAKKYLYKTDKKGKFQYTPQTDALGDPTGKLAHVKKTRLKPAKVAKAIDIAAAGAAGVIAEKIISAAKKRNQSTKDKLEATKKKKYVQPPKSVRKNRGGTVRKSYNY
jgi:hypothetical protein